jgi:hypothetical protein
MLPSRQVARRLHAPRNREAEVRVQPEPTPFVSVAMIRTTLPLLLLSLLTACGTGDRAQRRSPAVRTMASPPTTSPDRATLPMPADTADNVPAPRPAPPTAIQTATFALG